MVCKNAECNCKKEDKKEGKKFDSGKLRYSLIKPEALREIAKVMMNGAEKYGDDNWKLVEFSRYVDALMRHTESYRLGDFIDKDSGLRTMAHVAACAIILLQKEIEQDREHVDSIELECILKSIRMEMDYEQQEYKDKTGLNNPKYTKVAIKEEVHSIKDSGSQIILDQDHQIFNTELPVLPKDSIIGLA